jgi:unsaturated rhamnogalacturonyl hydrolase
MPARHATRPSARSWLQAASVALTVVTIAAQAAAAERRQIGLTASGQIIEASFVTASSATAPTVLIIGGLHGRDASTRAIERALAAYDARPPARRAFHLIGIAVANPGASPLQFPPPGVAYREHVEAHVLWRWIGIHAPDLVLVTGRDEAGLAAALSQNVVAGVGRVPARQVEAGSLLEMVPALIPPSEARREIERRQARSPREVADELARIYGHDLDQFTYIPGMALLARVSLGDVADVERLVAPWADGRRDPLARPNSLALAGHLVFAALAERTGDPRYIAALRRAADLGFTETGEMRESMPFHDEMSDSLFMATAILAKAGKLTADRRYFDMAARHVAFMQKLVLRSDGLYRHSPLSDAAWGRGNAFPALGLALTLEDVAEDHPAYPALLTSFLRHMAALATHQTPEGLWRQVIDHPGAYAEFSSTAMIGLAMLKGIRRGWLDAFAYQPRVEAAWRAVAARIGRDGVLFDACESTNKQRSLDDYLRRAAILGRDPRGGGMAMLFAVEMGGHSRVPGGN